MNAFQSIQYWIGEVYSFSGNSVVKVWEVCAMSTEQSLLGVAKSNAGKHPWTNVKGFENRVKKNRELTVEAV